MKRFFAAAALVTTFASPLWASDYAVDVNGAHASINFKVKHLGFSWLTGRFNTFDGNFSYSPENLSDAKVAITIVTDSVDSNHAARDKHIRSDDFLDVEKFPEAKFVSTKIEGDANGEFKIHGDLTLHGVTKAITIDAVKVGEGKDPWGGYRAGFAGTTELAMADFGFKMDFGTVLMELNVEGIRK